MKTKLIILYLSSVVFFGCGKKNQKASVNMDGVTTISVSSVEETLQDTSCFKKPQIIVLETIEESLLSRIDRISFDENRLFIFDKNLMEILSFDLTGKYIGKVKNRGQGPGEYIQISDFAIDINQKQMILLCDVPNKLMYFTYDGTFVKEEKLDDYYMQLVTDNSYIYLERMNNTEIEKGQLGILSKQTDEMREAMDQIDIKNHFFISGNSLNKGKDILYVRRFDNSIYKVDDGEIFAKYNIDFQNYSFPDKLVREESSEIILKECFDNNYIFSMANIVNSGHYFMFTTNLGLFLYDKKNDVLNGYNQMLNEKWGATFFTYMPLDNTNNIICTIDDPSSIKHAVEHMPADKKADKKYSEMLDIVSTLTDENNPILFIYEFDD